MTTVLPRRVRAGHALNTAIEEATLPVRTRPAVVEETRKPVRKPTETRSRSPRRPAVVEETRKPVRKPTETRSRSPTSTRKPTEAPVKTLRKEECVARPRPILTSTTRTVRKPKPSSPVQERRGRSPSTRKPTAAPIKKQRVSSPRPSSPARKTVKKPRSPSKSPSPARKTVKKPRSPSKSPSPAKSPARRTVKKPRSPSKSPSPAKSPVRNGGKSLKKPIPASPVNRRKKTTKDEDEEEDETPFDPANLVRLEGKIFQKLTDEQYLKIYNKNIPDNELNMLERLARANIMPIEFDDPVAEAEFIYANDDYIDIVLTEQQEVHVPVLKKKIDRYKIAISASEPGTGKTVVALYMFLHGGYDGILVIAPHQARMAWTIASKYGITVEFVSYGNLVGKKNMQSKRPYITRDDSGSKPKFSLHPDFKEILDTKKYLIVFDEAHSTKNDSTYSAGAAEILRYIRLNDVESRILFLTATPVDADKSYPIYMYLMGLTVGVGDYAEKNDQGLSKVIELAEKIDKKKTAGKLEKWNSILGKKKPLNKDKSELAIWLYRHIIQSGLSDSMYRNRDDGLKHYTRNIILPMTHEEQEEYNAALDDLETEARKKELRAEGIKIAATDGNTQSLKHKLARVEKSKMEPLFRLQRNILDKHPEYKIVNIVNYLDSLKRINDLMRKRYKVVTISGAITDDNIRMRIVDSFQDPSMKSPNVLNGTIGTIGQSISLHDTDGSRPRILFVGPGQSIVEANQGAGRTDREGMKSDSLVYYFYGSRGDENKIAESDILERLTEKGENIRDGLTGEYRQKYRTPSEFDTEIVSNGRLPPNGKLIPGRSKKLDD